MSQETEKEKENSSENKNQTNIEEQNSPKVKISRKERRSIKKEIKIDLINNFRPPADLLNEFITNLNNANNLKNSSNSLNKNTQLSDEIQEKTIINDDIEEEEKNENMDKEYYGDQQLFDDIDQDLNDSNTIINNNKNNKNDDENNNDIDNIKKNKIFKGINEDFNQNKRKCFEADDIMEYNKNMEKEKLIEIGNENESNTINTKSSFNRSKRKINKNYFNKSKQYPINKKDLKLGIKMNRNSPFINQYQLGKNNNYLQTSKKIFNKELFKQPTKKKIQKNNLSSSNYKLFKEKTKSNLHLKYNSYNNKENNINSILVKNKPIIKHNSNMFYFPNGQFIPKTNRNKNTINENPKFDLIKNNNYLNNSKNERKKR